MNYHISTYSRRKIVHSMLDSGYVFEWDGNMLHLPEEWGCTRLAVLMDIKYYQAERGDLEALRYVLRRRYSTQSYRAEAYGVENGLDFDKVVDLFIKAAGICPVCGQKKSIDQLVIEHIIPLSGGGTNTIDNVQIICDRCNMAKVATEKSGVRYAKADGRSKLSLTERRKAMLGLSGTNDSG